MRGAAGLVAVVLALAPAAAQAGASHLLNDTSLLLAPGERVTVRPAAGGRLTLVSAVPEDPAHALPPRPGPKGPGAGNPLIETADGTVSFLIGPMGDGAILKVENGTSKAFDYQAVLLLAGAGEGAPVREPTGVCTVLPLLPSWETWPRRRVTGILLSHFVSRDTNQVVFQERPKAPAAKPSPSRVTPVNNPRTLPWRSTPRPATS